MHRQRRHVPRKSGIWEQPCVQTLSTAEPGELLHWPLGHGWEGQPFLSLQLPHPLCLCRDQMKLSKGAPGLALPLNASPFPSCLSPATRLSYRTGLPVSLRGSEAAPHLMAWTTLNSVFCADVIAREDIAAGGECWDVFTAWWHKAFRPVRCLGSCERQCCSEEMGLAGRVKTKLL